MTVLINASNTSGLTITSDTSGNIAFQSSGANVITTAGSNVTVAGALSTSSRGISASSMPSGSVLQVKSTTTSTSTSTTSQNYVATNMSVSITPTSSTSKIFVTANFPSTDTGSSGQSFFSIYRDSTLLSGFNGFTQFYVSSNPNFVAPVGISYLDSPATTNATTYAVYIRTGAGQSITAIPSSESGTITVMEIAV